MGSKRAMEAFRPMSLSARSGRVPCPDSARRFRLGRAMTLRTVGFDGAGLRARARGSTANVHAALDEPLSTIREGALSR
jgi:hypothetical protein